MSDPYKCDRPSLAHLHDTYQQPKMPPSPTTFHLISNVFYALNRLYAYWSFLVNYTLYTSLWLLGGIPPNTDARVDADKGWHPAVFVTGCRGDVGRETVRLLAKKGYTVFAATKSREEGVMLGKGLTSSHGSIHPILCDLSAESLEQAVGDIRRYEEENPGRRLVAVVCDAGICALGALEHLTNEEINVRPLALSPRSLSLHCGRKQYPRTSEHT